MNEGRPAAVAVDWQDFLLRFRQAAEQAGFRHTLLADSGEPAIGIWERPGDGPRVYLSGGMHGDEPAGPFALLELLRDGHFGDTGNWALCPAINLSGLALGTRENADGIDLNRDYFVRKSPAVRAHAAWLESRPAPSMFISLHEDWESTGFYFYEINLAADNPHRAREILSAAERWFPREAGPRIDGHDSREAGWIYHAAEPDLPEGWPEAIFLAKLGCPLSFTFETPSRAPFGSRVAAHVAAVSAALRACC